VLVRAQRAPLPTGRYEAGPSPLLLAWSDASCSSRFYDYGSAQMAQELQRAPEKAGRWRTEEIHEAVSFGEILAAAEAPSMDEGGAVPTACPGAAAAPPPVDGGGGGGPAVAGEPEVGMEL